MSKFYLAFPMWYVLNVKSGVPLLIPEAYLNGHAIAIFSEDTFYKQAIENECPVNGRPIKLENAESFDRILSTAQLEGVPYVALDPNPKTGQPKWSGAISEIREAIRNR